MELVLPLLNLGLGGAALGALIVVIFKLLDVMKGMNDNLSKTNAVTESLDKNVIVNTEAVKASSASSATAAQAAMEASKAAIAAAESSNKILPILSQLLAK